MELLTFQWKTWK